MRAGESILVFPGGGREVFKHKGEKYRLIWKERMGFARLAIEHGYPIVPLAAVGAEECYDILVDSDELLHTPIGPLLERIAPRPDEIPPLVRGIGPLPRPRALLLPLRRADRDTRAVAGASGRRGGVLHAARARAPRPSSAASAACWPNGAAIPTATCRRACCGDSATSAQSR